MRSSRLWRVSAPISTALWVILTVTLVMAAGGCRSAGAPKNKVEELIATGKTTEAIAAAREMVKADPADATAKHLLALALVAEAGTRSPSDPATEKGWQANLRIADLYVEASAYDPSVPGIYTGLLRLAYAGKEPSWPPPEGALWLSAAVDKVAPGWRAGVQKDPALARDRAAAKAAGVLAMLADDFRLAADLSPDWLDAQMAAAKALTHDGHREEALPYLRRAMALAGDRTDVLVLAAILGEVKARETEKVLDLDLGGEYGIGGLVVRGRQVFFAKGEGGPNDALFVVGPDGSSEQLVSRCWGSFDVTADVKQLVFATAADRQGPTEIKVLDLTTRQVRPLTVLKGVSPV